MILPLRVAWLLRRKLAIVEGPPAHEAKVPAPYIPFDRPERFVDTTWVHCSASDNPQHDNIATIRRWHLDRGFNDVGYHWVILKSGQVIPGRTPERMPAAQKGHNKRALAVCVTGKRIFSPAQFESLNVLADVIEVAYDDQQIRFRGHCEVSSKLCPVFDYRAVLGLDKDGYRR